MDLLSSYDDEASNAEHVPGGVSKTTSEISEVPSLQSEWENFEKSVECNSPPNSSDGLNSQSSKVDESNSHLVRINTSKSAGSDSVQRNSCDEDESHLPPGVRKKNRCHSSSSSSSEDERAKDKAKSHSDSDTSCSDDSDASPNRSKTIEKKVEVKRMEVSPPKKGNQGHAKKARHGSSSSRSRSGSPRPKKRRSRDRRSRSRSPRGRLSSNRRRGSRHSRSKDRDHFSRRRRTRSRERRRSDRYHRGGFSKNKRSRSRERSKRSPSVEEKRSLSKDRSKRSISKDRSKRSISKDRIKRSLSKDRSKRSISKDRSKRSLSKDRSKRSLSKDRSKRSLSKDRSKRSISKDRIKRSMSKDRSKRSLSKDRIKRSLSKDRSKRSLSKDRSKRSLSKDRSKRSLSKDRSKRSLSKDRSKRSVSKDRSKKRSRSRDRKKRSKSRERTRRSRSRERTKRSRSRDRRRRSNSRNRSGSPREARVIKYGDRVIKAGASFGRPPPSKPMTFKEKMRQQLIKTIEEGGDMAQAFTDKDGTVFCTQTAGTQQAPAAKMPPVPLMANLVPPPAGLPAATITASEAAVQSMLALQKETTEKTGVEIPKYYNPAAINPMKYAEQVQKRKLLWSKTKDKDVNTQWNTTSLSSDHDDRSKEKFRKLMGIKQEGGNSATTSESPASEEQDMKQKELFEKLDKEYQFARMTTHTHRGVGLGFGSSSYQPHDA